jgi:hypothetical protein
MKTNHKITLGLLLSAVIIAAAVDASGIRYIVGNSCPLAESSCTGQRCTGSTSGYAQYATNVGNCTWIKSTGGGKCDCP